MKAPAAVLVLALGLIGVNEAEGSRGKMKQVQNVTDGLIEALIQVESGGDDAAVGDFDAWGIPHAVGCLQIHPGYVQDVNRMIGKPVYKLADRLDRQKSIEMARVYLEHYAAGLGIEAAARIHNGGPTGYRKAATAPYWAKVKKVLELKG